MSTQEIQIIVDRQARMIAPGLKHGIDLRNLFGISTDDHIYLEIKGDIDIPISPSDFILITGGEEFSIGTGHITIDDNPHLRHPIRCTFNEQRLTEAQALRRPKLTGEELKRFDPGAAPGSRLVADLDGLADETIEDHFRLIVKANDQFIIVPPSDESHQPRNVQVTIDGRQVTLPAGEYVVSVLKLRLDVPAEYELEHIQAGKFQPLTDSSVFKLHHDDEFISHVRTGSSS